MPFMKKIAKKTICLPVTGKTRVYAAIEADAVQKKVLRHLMRRAKFTAFGEHYRFTQLLDSDDFTAQFKKTVPVHAYREMYIRWWYRLLNGETYVTWPGKQKYFLTKGNDNKPTGKYIPVSRAIIRSLCITGKQHLSVSDNNTSTHFDKALLKPDYNKTYYSGTLPGIISHHKPLKYHCCFHNLFCSDDKHENRGFFLTEAGWVGSGIKDKDSEFQLIVNNGLYYEFIPFSNSSGGKKIRGVPIATLSINETEENAEYLIIITNNSGAWRYLTGYVIAFTDKEKLLFKITGKIKTD
jgi:hypothetical protein